MAAAAKADVHTPGGLGLHTLAFQWTVSSTEGLFIIEPLDDGHHVATASIAKQQKLRHTRLGHLNHRDLYRLASMSTGIPALPTEHSGLDTCKLSAPPVALHSQLTRVCKARHRPFPESDARAAARLEMLHMDTLTLEQPSIGGYHYALVVVDDHTHVVWIFPLHTEPAAEWEG
jgi:hypothetical protein